MRVLNVLNFPPTNPPLRKLSNDFLLTAQEDLTSAWRMCVIVFSSSWCFFFYHVKVWDGAPWPVHSLLCQLWLSDLLIKVPANEHVSLITAINTVFTHTACTAKYFTDWKGGCVCVCVRIATCVHRHQLILHVSHWEKLSRVLPSPFPISAAEIAWFVTWSEEKENL